MTQALRMSIPKTEQNLHFPNKYSNASKSNCVISLAIDISQEMPKRK